MTIELKKLEIFEWFLKPKVIKSDLDLEEAIDKIKFDKWHGQITVELPHEFCKIDWDYELNEPVIDFYIKAARYKITYKKP